MNLIEKLEALKKTVYDCDMHDAGKNGGINHCIEVVKDHNPWISVNTPPDTDKNVLIIDSNGDAVVGYFWDGKAWNAYSDVGLVNVKYWMDIPKGAKE